jgi:hypothetical protein
VVISFLDAGRLWKPRRIQHLQGHIQNPRMRLLDLIKKQRAGAIRQTPSANRSPAHTASTGLSQTGATGVQPSTAFTSSAQNPWAVFQ